MGGVWVQLLGGQGASPRFILVLREYIWNGPAVSLALPSFDGTGSLGSPPRQVVYPRLNGFTRGDYFPFSCGEYGD